MNIKILKNHTTTNIGIVEHEILSKLAARHGLKNIQFLNAAIIYLKKTGVDPTEPELSSKEELSKLDKRVNEVIKFFRMFEQDKLTPILQRLIILEKKIESNLDDLPLQSEIKTEFVEIKNILKRLLDEDNRSKQIFIQNTEKLVQAQQEHTSVLEKNNKMLISFFEAFRNRGIVGKLSEQDIKNFYNASH